MAPSLYHADFCNKIGHVRTLPNSCFNQYGAVISIGGSVDWGLQMSAKFINRRNLLRLATAVSSPIPIGLRVALSHSLAPGRIA